MARTRTKPDRARPAPGGARPRGRLAAFTLGIGIGIVVVFALVFSIAIGNRGIAVHATALHYADEALRSATVVRSQAGLAAHFGVLERDFGFEAADAIKRSSQETRLGLDNLPATRRDPRPDGDQLDALTAAYMAHLYRQGRYWAIAAPGETPLIFPDPRAPGPDLLA